MQIGQTELIMPINRHYQVTRRRTWVRREAKFVQNTRHIITKIRQMTNFHLNFCFLLTLHPQQKDFVKLLLCLGWCVHFATPRHRLSETLFQYIQNILVRHIFISATFIGRFSNFRKHIFCCTKLTESHRNSKLFCKVFK